MIRRLKACLNGGRSEPFVPKTPAELVDAAVAAVAAGAEAVHLHPRGPDGRESLAPADVSGEPVTSNADLVRLALAVWSSVRR